MMPLIFDSPQTIQDHCLNLRSQGKYIALVPTMGALHAGHLSLLEQARSLCDELVISIFVNPLQFDQKSDLDKYPRTWDSDLAAAANNGVTIVYAPKVSAMYPDNFQTRVSLTEVTRGMCGDHRPGHFDGVATVVLKLFNAVQPHIAFFGEKDYQQLKLIEQMTSDLNLPLHIKGCSTVREHDGLALSSRNVHLSARQRAQAPQIYAGLRAARALALKGELDCALAREAALKMIKNADLMEVEYLEIRQAETLKPVTDLKQPCRMLVAVKLGSTRLIDNIALNY